LHYSVSQRTTQIVLHFITRVTRKQVVD